MRSRTRTIEDILFVFLMALIFLAFSVSLAKAGGLEWSEDLVVAPSFGYAKNNGSRDGGPQVGGGFFFGTLFEKRVGENKQIGVLGFVITGSTPVGEGLDMAYAATGCPVTFFNDTIQPCYGYNFTDGAGMLYVGVGKEF